jgi:hypothetical protein
MAAACGLNRGKDHNEDLVGVAVIHKIFCCVAAVAVEDEDAVTRARFALRSSIKNLLEPEQTDIVISPSR